MTLNTGAIEGMTRAARTSERSRPGWQADAFTFLCHFLTVCGAGEQFIAPRARKWAEERGLDAPPSNRAWGSVFHRASRAGLIKRAGAELYADESMNTQLVTLWAVA